jgi:hypothetical protein
LVKAQINDRQWLITDEEEHPHKRTSENLIYLGKTNMVSPFRMLEVRHLLHHLLATSPDYWR